MDRTGTPRRLWSDRTIYLLLGLLVLVYLAFRAALVPWVHDECASLFWYVERGLYLPGQAHADANNHFLSTAIGVAAHKLRGLSLPASRVGSLIAFLIHAWAVYRIGLGLKDRTVRWSAWAALLLCPFLLDFFSLFRGYALQTAFWAVAIDGGLRYAAHQRTRHLVQLLLALVLANAAVLSLVPVWALIVAALAVPPALHWLRHDERPATAPVLAWVLLGVLPLFIATLLSLELRRAGLLYHGSTEGFVAVTVRSIVRLLVGNGGLAAAWAVAAIVIFALVQAVRRPVKPGPLAWLGALLAADVLVRIALAQVAGINYPADRAGLYLVPLAIQVVAFAADEAAPRRAMRTIGLLALWFLPLRTLYTANMDHTLLWPEQSVPVRFLQYIAAKQEGMGRPVVIGAYHQLGLALPYAARLHALPLDMPHTDGFPHGPHEVRIVDARYIEAASVGFHVVDHAPGPGLWLLDADRRLRTAIFSQQAFPATVTEEAFVWIDHLDTVRLGEPVMLQLECRITASDVPADLRLVATVDSAGIEVHRMEKLLGAMRPEWHDDVLHTTLCMPARPHADHRNVYLWNPGGARTDVRPVQVKRHRFPASVPH